jgi:hypothetical protein
MQSASVDVIRLMGERRRTSVLLRPRQSASVCDHAVITDWSLCVRLGDADRTLGPVTAPQPTEEEAAAMAWMNDVGIVGDSFGPEWPFLVFKDGTVITYEVPED